MIKKIKCRLGWHHWEYFTPPLVKEAPGFKETMIGDGHYYPPMCLGTRLCLNCGKKQQSLYLSSFIVWEECRYITPEEKRAFRLNQLGI